VEIPWSFKSKVKEKCLNFNNGCWVHVYQLKANNDFTWSWVFESMASNWKWKMFLLQLGLLSSWLPIESESVLLISAWVVKFMASNW
jgi:hypothetical protein